MNLREDVLRSAGLLTEMPIKRTIVSSEGYIQIVFNAKDGKKLTVYVEIPEDKEVDFDKKFNSKDLSEIVLKAKKDKIHGVDKYKWDNYTINDFKSVMLNCGGFWDGKYGEDLNHENITGMKEAELLFDKFSGLQYDV